MWDVISEIFSADAWVPRGHCGTWGAWATWYIAGQFAVAAAYLAIPLGLVNLWRANRTKLVFAPLLLSFGAFIASCGATHVLDGAAFWWPAYRFNTLVIWLTAIASWLTAVYGAQASKHLATWRSPDEYQAIIDDRDRALEKSTAATKDLERLISDLRLQSQDVQRQLDVVKKEIYHLQWVGEAKQRMAILHRQMDEIKASVARIGV